MGNENSFSLLVKIIINSDLYNVAHSIEFQKYCLYFACFLQVVFQTSFLEEFQLAKLMWFLIKIIFNYCSEYCSCNCNSS